ncbi:MAG: tetratricopeptide repeat protein [Abditibacteriales bacterium]|nr:tetratricopeptide repeat protein [Abditibacteriales bacterium]MDW8364322.1 redoxin domain-containing protein [Abditibacteriales bacterium]
MRRWFVSLLVWGVVVGWGVSASAQRQLPPDVQALQKIQQMKTPAEKVTALRQFFKDYPDSRFGLTARMWLFQALAAMPQSPEAELLAAAEDYLSKVPAQIKPTALNNVAWELAKAKRALDKAKQYSEESLKLLPPNAPPDSRAAYQDTLGYIYYQQGDYETALEWFQKALSQPLENDGEIRFHLAQTHEKLNQLDEALTHYLRVAGQFFEDEHTKEAEAAYLRLGQSKGRTTEELQRELAQSKKAGRDAALQRARYEKPAPAWELPKLEGGTARMSDFAGKVVVLDWWGSWCPPCRAELPHFQALYTKYKDRVVFIGMNWEQPTTPDRVGTVKKFMADNRYDFPVVLDHDQTAGRAYGIEAFPTVFVVDRRGNILYRNIGYRPGVERLLEAQIEDALSR